MTLFNCPECKRGISDKAEKCPHCGCPVGKKAPPRRSCIGKLWRGQYPLRQSFWLAFFSVFLIINISIYALPRSVALLLMPPTRFCLFFILVAFLIYTAYLVICFAAVWRSSARYGGNRIWAYCARAFVVFYAFNSLYLTLSGFILPLLKLSRLVN